MSRNELRNQIAKCRRLARLSDDETARRLLELADEYEARMAQPLPVMQDTALAMQRNGSRTPAL